MAKLTEIPSQAIIDGYKGKVDFYLWNGVPCARKWPRSPGHSRAPTVQATWPAFSYIASQWNTLSDDIRERYNSMASGTGLNGRDVFTRSYLTGLYNNS